jgi:hypothetical protein
MRMIRKTGGDMEFLAEFIPRTTKGLLLFPLLIKGVGGIFPLRLS